MLAEKRSAFMKDKDKRVTINAVKRAMMDALQLMHSFDNRFIVPDDFLPDHPEREKMIKYLKALSWKGTDSGAAMVAGVSLRKVREWREYEEFADMEELADKACTDLVHEVALTSAYTTGDRQMILAVLKARDERFADRQEITGAKGGPVQFQIHFGDIPRPKRLD